ncbi:hypothetical protein KM176_02085 [Pseudooceanicola sp. CBS1P-1]|uniref:hypothetical protein n=1 Tax=Pseudooceanicola endophyticus TaxID=2841273 RepID=UPI001C0117BA|nr:hypothetical protein [Pseudooceanicola endophyticus]MBT9382637.1 hypothetical protein [Pseudooceanicola endophyticus]
MLEDLEGFARHRGLTDVEQRLTEARRDVARALWRALGEDPFLNAKPSRRLDALRLVPLGAGAGSGAVRKPD